MVHRLAEALRSTIALAAYWLRVFPQARRELHRWQLRARAIPDPALQRLALAKLRDEGVCAEGVAAFAILAVSHRAALVRLCVAFEVMYDYVDGLGEQPAADPLANNRQLGRAFAAAVDPSVPLVDFYAFHPRANDGGYVNALVGACRGELTALPSYRLIAPALRRAAERAAEAQSLNHSGALGDDLSALERWAAGPWSPAELRWWETAAAAAAPLGIYALAALASVGDVPAEEVARVESAYFPWIAGLLGLLESLVDRDEDAAAGTHNFVEHYGSPGEAAERAALLARRSSEHVGVLRRASRHRVILAGMVATNLSHHGADDDAARLAAAKVREHVDGPLAALLLLLRTRRRLTRPGLPWLSGAA